MLITYTCTNLVLFREGNLPRAVVVLKGEMCAAHRGLEFCLDNVRVRGVHEQVNVRVFGYETAAAHGAE